MLNRTTTSVRYDCCTIEIRQTRILSIDKQPKYLQFLSIIEGNLTYKVCRLRKDLKT